MKVFELFCFELSFGVLSISLIVWRLLLAMLNVIANCWLIFSIKILFIGFSEYHFYLHVNCNHEKWNNSYVFLKWKFFKISFFRKALSIINFWNCYRNFTCVKLLLLRGIVFQEIRVLYLLVCLFFSLLRFLSLFLHYFVGQCAKIGCGLINDFVSHHSHICGWIL